MKKHANSKVWDGLCHCYRVDDGRRFRLKDFDPEDTGKLTEGDKNSAKEALQEGVKSLSCLQDLLYAHDRWAVLLIFQAMDAAGKDSVIKHVMSGLNPQGCQVHSFKAPSNEELDHDFLWRCSTRLPERGRIGIFNRSYYEETLVVRVHPEILERQKLPKACQGKSLWKDRFEDIRCFERYLHRNGVAIVKFFLNVSPQEQRKRFLERLDDPEKHWKFSADDLRERARWGDYMSAYQETIRETAAPHAPWYVVPADHKWYTRLVVAAAVNRTLASLDLAYPKPDAEAKGKLAKARASLMKPA